MTGSANDPIHLEGTNHSLNFFCAKNNLNPQIVIYCVKIKDSHSDFRYSYKSL